MPPKKKRKATKAITPAIAPVIATLTTSVIAPAVVDSKETKETSVFFLKAIIPYHGGTRGMDLGCYSSLDKAKSAWSQYKGENDDDEDSHKGVITELHLDAAPYCWAKVSDTDLE